MRFADHGLAQSWRVEGARKGCCARVRDLLRGLKRTCQSSESTSMTLRGSTRGCLGGPCKQGKTQRTERAQGLTLKSGGLTSRACFSQLFPCCNQLTSTVVALLARWTGGLSSLWDEVGRGGR